VTLSSLIFCRRNSTGLLAVLLVARWWTFLRRIDVRCRSAIRWYRHIYCLCSHNLHQCSKHKMWPVVTTVSVSSLSRHNREAYNNGWANWDAIWDVDFGGPRNHVLGGGPRSAVERVSFVGHTWHAQICLWSIFSTIFTRGSSVAASAYCSNLLLLVLVYLACRGSSSGWLDPQKENH